MDEVEGKTQSTVQDHIEELRSRIKKYLFFLVGAIAVSVYYTNPIVQLIKQKAGLDLITIAPYEIVTIRLRMAAFIGFFLTLPVLLYHLIMFLKPGLRDDEYRYSLISLPIILLLFITGALFAYFIVIPLGFQFFKSMGVTAGIQNFWSVKKTVLFMFNIIIMCGILFQIPIISFLLTKIGIIDAEMLQAKRHYAIILILLISAMLSPPDVVTMLITFLPVYLLYELSIIISAKWD